MKEALVTGATGMVGRYVTERLVADGWTVRAFVRDLSSAAVPRWPGVELVLGNTLDVDSFTRAARGVDVVVHAAAAVTADGGWTEYERTNIQGTAHAIRAAEVSGARLVHVSSVAVYGDTARYRADGRLTDEDAPLTPLDPQAFYARSKRDSEALVMKAHAEGRIWATAVRPDVIYGRYDRQFVPRVAKILRRGIMPLIDGGHTILPIVHAASVADGIVRAAATEIAGGRAYNLANDFDVSVRQFFTLGAEGLEVNVRMPSIPPVVARPLLGMMRTAGALILGSKFNVVTSASFDFLTKNNPFTSDRARSELGWTPPMRPEVSIPDAFSFCRLA